MEETLTSELGPTLVVVDELLLLARINALQVPFDLCDHPSALKHILRLSPATLLGELSW